MDKRMKLIETRKNKGLKQKDVAKRLGITASYYGMIEQGVRKPNLTLALALEDLFSVPLGELFCDLEPNKMLGKCETA